MNSICVIFGFHGIYFTKETSKPLENPIAFFRFHRTASRRKKLPYSEPPDGKPSGGGMEIIMYSVKIRKAVGIAVLSFGAGILISYILPGFIVAFVEAAVILAAGFLLLKQ